MKTFEDFNGVDIREVWDFRLSTATPQIVREESGNWIVQIWSNENPDYDPEDPATLAEPLEVYDTGIPSCPKGLDTYDKDKIKKCFEWIYSVRDKYSRDHIELRKPVVKMINEANDRANQINAEAEQAGTKDDIALFDQKVGELKRHLETSNAEIKKASEAMHAEIAALNAGGAL